MNLCRSSFCLSLIIFVAPLACTVGCSDHRKSHQEVISRKDGTIQVITYRAGSDVLEFLVIERAPPPYSSIIKSADLSDSKFALRMESAVVRFPIPAKSRLISVTPNRIEVVDVDPIATEEFFKCYSRGILKNGIEAFLTEVGAVNKLKRDNP